MRESVDQSTTNTNFKKVKLDKFTFYFSLISIVMLCIFCSIWPNLANEKINIVKNFVIYKFDWFFMIFGIFTLVASIYVAFSKYGSIKLGKADDKPDFSMISWVAMLFCSAVGSNVILWAICEPLYYLNSPPFGYAPYSIEAYEISIAYGMFHWGPIAWSMFALPTLPVAYHLLVRNKHNLKISSVCSEGLDGKGGKYLKLLDVLVVFATFGAMGPSLGLGVPLLSAVISEFLGINQSNLLDFSILIIWVCIFSYSVYQGLEKGIQKLSNLNVILIIIMLIFILLFGGATQFIIQNIVDSTGNFVQYFMLMATNTDPINKSGFGQSWTVFYWAWYLAFAPFMMIFNAKISRGRTIKEFILGIIIIGSIGTCMFFMVLGNYTIFIQQNKIIDISSILLNEGTIVAVVEIFKTLPFQKVILPILVVLYFVFFATCVDSGAYAMACVTSDEIEIGQHPSRINRLVWAAVIALLGVSLLRMGSALSAIQASVIVLGFPVMIICYLLYYIQFKWFKEDFKDTPSNLIQNKNYYEVDDKKN